VTDLNAAMKQAKAENRLLMVYYTSDFCPPCEHLKEAVFPTAEFKQGAANLIRVYVDAYNHEAIQLISKFNLYSTPTTVIATADLDELGRFSGYRPTAEYLREINVLTGYKDIPVADAQKRLAELQKIKPFHMSPKQRFQWQSLRRRVGLYLRHLRKFKEAQELLVGLQEPEARRAFLYVSTEVAGEKEDWKTYGNYLDKYMREFGHIRPSLAYYGIRYTLKEHKAAKPILDRLAPRALTQLSAAIASHDSQASLYKKESLISMKAELLKLLERKDEANQMFAIYEAEIDRKRASAKDSKTKLGLDFDKADSLRDRGKIAESKQAMAQILKDYQDSYTAHSWAEWFYTSFKEDKDKDYQAAYNAAKRAVALAEKDRHHVSARIDLAQNALKLGKKQEARKAIKAALSKLSLPAWDGAWLHWYAQQARRVEAEIEGRYFKQEKKKQS